MKKLKDITVKQNPAPSARPLGVNPSDPWSAKAGITEGALEQYLMSKGVNPNFISTQMKISHAKSTAFLKWKQNHVESVEYVDEAGRCWTGYKPVPGKKAFSSGSCAKEEKGSQTTELTPEEVEVDEMTSMSMGGLRRTTTFNKGATAHHALAGHVTIGRTDKHTGMTQVTGVKDNKTYQVRMHTLKAHPIGESAADQVKKAKSSALDKFRAGSIERAKKHNDIQKNQSKDGSGMSSAIDRLAKHMGEEASQDAENKFHAKLDKLVHKTFGKRKSEMGMKEECNHKVGDSVTVQSKFFGKQKGKVVKVDDQSIHVKRNGKKFSEKYPHDSVMKEDVGDAKAAVNADGLPNASLEPVSEKRKQMTKSARMIKSLYKKKGVVKEDMFDSEKEDKSVATYGKKPKMSTTSKMSNLGDNKPEAASVLSGGTTLTGQKRDMLEIDPAMRNRPGQPDITKDTKKVR